IYKLWNLQIQCSRQTPAAYQQQIKTYYCPSRPPQILSMGDTFAQGGGGIGDYCPNFGTVNGVNNTQRNDGPIIEAVHTLAASGGFTIVTQWSGLLKIADVTDGTSNTLLFGEKQRVA